MFKILGLIVRFQYKDSTSITTSLEILEYAYDEKCHVQHPSWADIQRSNNNFIRKALPCEQFVCLWQVCSFLAWTCKAACKHGTRDACKTVKNHTLQHGMKYHLKRVLLILSYYHLTSFNYVYNSWFSSVISIYWLRKYLKI